MTVGAAFEAAAGDYDRARRQLVPGFDGFYGAALESVPFGREGRIKVLDLGAGTGLLGAMVAERFPRSRVTLVDLSVEMLRVARRRLAGEPGRFEFRNMDYARKALPGGPRGYDLVVSALSIHHLMHSDKRKLFEKVYGVLAGGGVFVNADQVQRDAGGGGALGRMVAPAGRRVRGLRKEPRRRARAHEGRQERDARGAARLARRGRLRGGRV